MLLSLPSKLDRTSPYFFVGVTCVGHVSLLIFFFVLEGYFGGERALIFDLRTMGSKVSMLSRPVQKRAQGTTRRTTNNIKRAPVQKKTPPKKIEKKSPPKKVIKKQPVKKVAPKQIANKTVPIKKVAPKVEKKEPVKKMVKEAPAAPKEPVVKEFNVADASVSSDKVIREIYRHLTIPPGIEDVEPFTMTFDINDKGKVVNLRPKGKEPLVMYTAFKDALLRCTMPIKNRKNIPLVIK